MGYEHRRTSCRPHSAYEKDKRAFHPPVSPSNYRETEPHGNQVASVLAGTLEDLA